MFVSHVVVGEDEEESQGAIRRLPDSTTGKGLNMNQLKHHPALAGPGIMFISAALFGYFGFFIGFLHTNFQGTFILFFALLDWTIKGTAVGFGLGGVITLFKPLFGNIVYGLTGLLSALMFVTISVMDFMDPHNMTISLPFLPGPIPLLLFAAWNGYGSWFGIRAVFTLLKTIPDVQDGPGSKT